MSSGMAQRRPVEVPPVAPDLRTPPSLTRINSGRTEGLKAIPGQRVESGLSAREGLRKYRRHFDLYGSELVLETAANDRALSDDDFAHLKRYVNRYAKPGQAKRGDRDDFRRRLREAT